MTEVVKIDPSHLSDDAARSVIERAGAVLRHGGLVAFPTETVYGLGGNAFDAEASARIYAAKGRPSDNPLIVHIARMEDLDLVASQIPPAAQVLAEHFWPGPLTMILKKQPDVPAATTGGLDTVAVRFPSHPVAQALILAAGGFVAAPSANVSGRPSPTKASHCIEDLTGRVNMIIDGGEVGIGVESSIIDLTGERPMILRPGYVTEEMLAGVLGEVRTDPAILADAAEPPEKDAQHAGLRPKAPGMRYRHYAPKGHMTMVEGEAAAVVRYINAEAEKQLAEGRRVAALVSEETAASYDPRIRLHIVGSREDPASVARVLFDVLRQCDAENMEEIWSERFGEGGLYRAINNRLEKACGHRIVRIQDED
ncbi:MAG: threonylcarbamoyl-AMP synthase [Lachnospiraceae bacterium]|nr:threonylcarbamoyl-AMP synthase [Lachnospiraceae bacterium]